MGLDKRQNNSRKISLTRRTTGRCGITDREYITNDTRSETRFPKCIMEWIINDVYDHSKSKGKMFIPVVPLQFIERVPICWSFPAFLHDSSIKLFVQEVYIDTFIEVLCNDSLFSFDVSIHYMIVNIISTSPSLFPIFLQRRCKCCEDRSLYIQKMCNSKEVKGHLWLIYRTSNYVKIKINGSQSCLGCPIPELGCSDGSVIHGQCSWSNSGHENWIFSPQRCSVRSTNY